MYKKLKNLTALMTASFSADMQAAAVIAETDIPNLKDEPLAPSILNLSIPTHLAAHRSHSSHGSHRSHRSSSGGYSAPSYPSNPSRAQPKKIEPKKEPEPQKKESDPLGQQKKPVTSYPPKTKKTLTEKIKDKELRKNIIMRMQLTLQFEGFYSGPIDGVMGPTTRDAVIEYRKSKGLKGNKIFDEQTLNAMGIKVD